MTAADVLSGDARWSVEAADAASAAVDRSLTAWARREADKSLFATTEGQP